MKTAAEVCKDREDLEWKHLWDILYADGRFDGLKCNGVVSVDEQIYLRHHNHLGKDVYLLGSTTFPLVTKYKQRLIDLGYTVTQTEKDIHYTETLNVVQKHETWYGRKYETHHESRVEKTTQVKSYTISACCGEDK